MSEMYQFAPIRVFSGAKANKKCVAITDLLTKMLNRRSYDSGVMSRDAILASVNNKCRFVNEAYKTLGNVSAKLVKNVECNDKRDWRMEVLYTKESGEAINVCSFMCFVCLGDVSEYRNVSMNS